MLSQDVKAMKAGDARPAFLLAREGRPIALFLVWAFPDRFLLTCDESAAPAARAHLDKYVIADDVAIGEPAGGCALFVGTLSADLAATPPEPGRFVEGESGLVVARRDFGRRPAYALADRGVLGRRVSSFVDLEAARVEEGVPAWGAEIDGRVLPTETGPMDAISTTKGCYPGQEPVIMSLHRGHPPTRLCRVSIEGDAVPARDEALLLDGRGAGRVTTAVETRDGVRALALVRHADAKEGASLRLASGAAVAVTQVLV
jgi:folate-binding protein YgfZ